MVSIKCNFKNLGVCPEFKGNLCSLATVVCCYAEATNPPVPQVCSKDLLYDMKDFVKRMRDSEEYCGGMDQNAPTSYWRAKEEVYEELAEELEKILAAV